MIGADFFFILSLCREGYVALDYNQQVLTKLKLTAFEIYLITPESLTM
jgi:hypothetical protein